MTAPPTSQRHLSRDGLREYLRSGAPSVVKIDGTPVVYLVIEPILKRLVLRTPLTGQPIPDLATYRHISAETIYWNDTQWCELRIEGEMISDAYPVLCSIADRIQLQSLDFRTAVTGALSSLHELLAGARRLSEQQEIGLFGELLVVKHLLGTMATAEALASWRGPEGEEHDISLAGGDVEVKSTIAEERCHWIGDVRQLEPTIGRRLWLLSLQLTGAGAGGVTLPDLIEQLRVLVTSDTALEEFERKLDAVGWRDDTENLYLRRLRLRSKPECYLIDRDFPAITPQRLVAAGLDQNRFVQIRYMIDLSGLKAETDMPEFLSTMSTEG
jgi:Putative  PD-(D/E)XK family member, (DUF4420)